MNDTPVPQAKTPISQPRTHGSPSTAVAAGIVAAMLAMLVIPAAIALHSVKRPATLQVLADASPHGYTWSLLLFILADDWCTGPDWVPLGCDLCAMVLLFPEPANHARNSGASVGTLGTRRGVRFLLHRLHHDSAALCLDERILARGVHSPGLSRRGALLAETAEIPSHIAGGRSRSDRRGPVLQEVVLARA